MSKQKTRWKEGQRFLLRILMYVFWNWTETNGATFYYGYIFTLLGLVVNTRFGLQSIILLKDLKSATSNSKASILNLVYLFFIRRHKGHAINKLQASIINSKWLIIQLINTELNLILFKFAWTFGYYWMSIEKIGCWNSYTIELL